MGNTGLQDAANLAWKMAAVISGQATPILLESYGKERRPIAEWVLGTSDALFAGITEQKSAVFNVLRKCMMKFAMSIVPEGSIPPSFLKSKMFGTSHSYSEAGTCRNIGDWTRSHGSLRAGDRLPYLLCTQVGGTKITTLDLLTEAVPTYLIILVGRVPPLEEDLNRVILELQPLHVPLKICAYTCPAKPCFACLPVAKIMSVTAPAPAYHDLSEAVSLKPIDPSSTDLADLLKLPSEGKAMLAVRPDGYIAVIHQGAWDAQAVRVALSETGISTS